MNTDIIKIKENLLTMTTDPVTMARVWQEVMNAKRFIADVEKAMKAQMLELMREGDIREIDLGNEVKIIKGVKKTDRFETEYIYKVLNFTEEQQAVLPKNPAFRKNAILLNEKTAPAYTQEESEVVEVKELDVKLLKTLGKK